MDTWKTPVKKKLSIEKIHCGDAGVSSCAFSKSPFKSQPYFQTADIPPPLLHCNLVYTKDQEAFLSSQGTSPPLSTTKHNPKVLNWPPGFHRKTTGAFRLNRRCKHMFQQVPSMWAPTGLWEPGKKKKKQHICSQIFAWSPKTFVIT